MVQQQRFTLDRIGSTMSRLSTQLTILAPGSIARIPDGVRRPHLRTAARPTTLRCDGC
jgi:hypothetical protein